MNVKHPLRSLLPPLLASLLLVACSGESPDKLLASAKDYLAKNDNKAAVIQLKNALQSNPELPEARFLLGKALLGNGEGAPAEVELRKALALKYAADQAVPKLALALLLQGQNKKVTDEFATTTLGTPEGTAELQTTLAVAYAAQKDAAAADKALAAALAAKPDHAPALLIRARQAAATGDLAAALGIVDSVLARTPAHVEALKARGDLLAAKGDPEAALAEYRKILASTPDHLSAHLGVVSILLSQGKTAEAEAQVGQLKQVAPRHPMTMLLDARMALLRKDLPKARELVQQILRSAPDHVAALQLAGAVEFQSGAFVQAELHLSKLLRLTPNNLEARRLLTMTYLRLGQPGRAKQAIEPLLAQVEGNSDLLSLAGEVAIANGDVAQAEKHFLKAAALDPKNVQKRTAVALTHLAKGGESAFSELEQIASADTGVRADMALISVSIQRGQFDKALKAIDALEKKQPNTPQPHHLRGGAFLGKKDLAGARRSFERALAISPAYFPSAAALATLDLGEKRPDEARKRFESVLAADPKSVESLLALADLKVQSGGTPDEVADLLNRAVSANPTLPGARLALINFHWRNKDVKKTLASAQDAVAAIPDRPELLETLGQAQQAAGETNQALATFAKQASMQPNSPLPHLRAAEVHLQAKDRAAATQSLRKSLAVRPDYVEAQRLLIGVLVESGSRSEALALAREVQKQRPKEAWGYLFEGDIRIAEKAWPEAAAAFRNGLKQVTASELATRLHAVLVAGKNAAEAERFSAGWLKDHPKDAAFVTYLGDSAMAAKDWQGAARHYRSVVTLQPNNPVALNNLAWASHQMKDAKAIEYAEKAHRLAPGQPAIMDTLAVILLAKGDTAKALDLLRKASAAAPQSNEIRVNLVRALVQGGDKAAARKEYDALVKLGDKGPKKEVLDQLSKDL